MREKVEEDLINEGERIIIDSQFIPNYFKFKIMLPYRTSAYVV